MTDRDVLCGGLVRLLADHYGIKYQARVLLWSQLAGESAGTSLTVLSDYRRIDEIIEAIGSRMAQLDCRYPDDMSAMAALSSLSRQPVNANLKKGLICLRAHHETIVDDVELLKTMLALDEGDPDDALLSMIAAQHRASLRTLGAMVVVPYSEIS